MVPEKDCHPIKGVFLPHDKCSHDEPQIHSKSDLDAVVNEDEWIIVPAYHTQPYMYESDPESHGEDNKAVSIVHTIPSYP